MSLTLMGASFMFVSSLPIALVGERFGLDAAFAGGATTLLILAVVLGMVWPPLRKLSA